MGITAARLRGRVHDGPPPGPPAPLTISMVEHQRALEELQHQHELELLKVRKRLAELEVTLEAATAPARPAPPVPREPATAVVEKHDTPERIARKRG